MELGEVGTKGVGGEEVMKVEEVAKLAKEVEEEVQME